MPLYILKISHLSSEPGAHGIEKCSLPRDLNFYEKQLKIYITPHIQYRSKSIQYGHEVLNADFNTLDSLLD